MLKLKVIEGIKNEKVCGNKKVHGDNAVEMDQFFTKPQIAKELISETDKLVGFSNFDIIIEPSAGSGSFYDFLPQTKRIGIDIDATPQSPYIQKDFLLLTPLELGIKDRDKVLIIGNPPFGKNSSKALQFLNHSFLFSNFVCFILPNTFNKTSIQNKIDLNFSLRYSKELPLNSFILNGQDYDVPCVFQIWEKSERQREKKKTVLTHKDFRFVKSLEDGKDVFIIQRVGARAGQILKNTVKTSKNYYYIEPLTQGVLERFQSLNLENSRIKYQTAGYPSIGKGELIEMYDLGGLA